MFRSKRANAALSPETGARRQTVLCSSLSYLWNNQFAFAERAKADHRRIREKKPSDSNGPKFPGRPSRLSLWQFQEKKHPLDLLLSLCERLQEQGLSRRIHVLSWVRSELRL